MADSDLSDVFGGLTLGLLPQTLRFEGGNIVIRLSDAPSDILILHEKVLSAASDRFAMRFNSSRWAPTREVKVLKTGETVQIYEYHLVYADDTYTLTDDKEKAAKKVSAVEGFKQATAAGRGGRGGRGALRGYGGYGGRGGYGLRGDRRVRPDDGVTYVKSFQRSDLVQGYKYREGFNGLMLPEAGRAQSVLHHKMLFNILYGQSLDFDSRSDQEALFALTEIIALAEYLLLLPAVAERITEYIKEVPGLWKDISACPEYYVIIGDKLRSYDIFSDAMRHHVGKHIDQRISHYQSYGSLGEPFAEYPGIQLLAAHLHDRLRTSMGALETSLRELALSWYQPHANAPTKRQRGLEVKTTWIAASLQGKTIADKCEWIASSIYREKLDQLIVGESHWSHIEYKRAGRTGGLVEAGSLYIACKAILLANNSPHALDLFGKKVAGRFASIFELNPSAEGHPGKLIGQELRRLVRVAASVINSRLPIPGISPPQSYTADPSARYHDKIEYFTNLQISPYRDVPWAKEVEITYDPNTGEMVSPWEKFEPDVEVNSASEEWARTVGLD